MNYIHMGNTHKSNNHNFICPISQKYFYKPVFFEEYFFEESVLDEWLNMHNIHPITKKIISENKYYDCVWFNNLLKEFYKKNPKYLNKQYKEEFNEEKIYKLFNDNQIDDLLKYLIGMKVQIKFTNCDDYVKLLKNDKITKYLIDNDINCINIWNYQLVHFICCYSTSEMIKYIIDKKYII